MSGDQRALTGVKGDFPTVFQEIERGRASYMQLSMAKWGAYSLILVPAYV